MGPSSAKAEAAQVVKKGKQRQKKVVLHKVCKHCSTSFTTTSKAKQYCTASCQDAAKSKRFRRSKAATQVRRYTSKADKFIASAFGLYIVNECKRAGTVQVLQGHTVDSLRGLERLYRYRQKASGYVDGKSAKAFELSHIHPVTSSSTGRVGALHPDNLVVTPVSPNRKHGTRSPDREEFGRFIAAKALQSRFKVDKETSHKEVFRLIKNLLGDVWQEFVATAVVQATQAAQLRTKLEKLFGLKLPESQFDLDALKQIATSKGVAFFSLNFAPYDPLVVMQHELDRFGHGIDSENEFSIFSKWVSLFNDSFDYFQGGRPDLTEADEKALEKVLVQAIFDGLHGLWAVSRPEQSQALLMKFLKPAPTKTTHSEIDAGDTVDEYADCPL